MPDIKVHRDILPSPVLETVRGNESFSSFKVACCGFAFTVHSCQLKVKYPDYHPLRRPETETRVNKELLNTGNKNKVRQLFFGKFKWSLKYQKIKKSSVIVVLFWKDKKMEMMVKGRKQPSVFFFSGPVKSEGMKKPRQAESAGPISEPLFIPGPTRGPWTKCGLPQHFMWPKIISKMHSCLQMSCFKPELTINYFS